MDYNQLHFVVPTETADVIEQLEALFEDLNDNLLFELQRRKITVHRLLNFLTLNLTPTFAENIMEDYELIKDIATVFYSLNKNRYWDYLNINILEGIMAKFKITKFLEDLTVLKKEIKQFMANTTVQQFYDAEEDTIKDTVISSPIPPNGFVEYISTHSWGPATLLAEIENYRRRLESMLENKLIHQAVVHVILVGVEKGSTKVIMFVPESIKLIIESIDISFFNENQIIELEIEHTCVFKKQENVCY